jgi:hypothetical protein
MQKLGKRILAFVLEKNKIIRSKVVDDVFINCY